MNVLGAIFQIRDDYLNLQSDAYTKNKGFGEDLTEGKFSFPIIHSIRSDPSDIQLLSILKQRTEDDDVKLFAIRRIESTGSFEYTRQKIVELMAEAKIVAKATSEDIDCKGIDRIVEMIGINSE